MTIARFTNPLDIALPAARLDLAATGQGSLLRQAAVTLAATGRFREALMLCQELTGDKPLLCETLLEIAMDMLRQSRQQTAAENDCHRCDCAIKQRYYRLRYHDQYQWTLCHPDMLLLHFHLIMDGLPLEETAFGIMHSVMSICDELENLCQNSSL